MEEAHLTLSNTYDIEQLIDNFKTASIIWKPKQYFINDINTIISELNNYFSFINLDIYEVLVSCGHNLTWDQEYNVSIEDINWFKFTEGKKIFFNSLNVNDKLTNVFEYYAVLNIHNKLCELFELQLE